MSCRKDRRIYLAVVIERRPRNLWSPLGINIDRNAAYVWQKIMGVESRMDHGGISRHRWPKAAESLELYAILKPKEKNKGHGNLESMVGYGPDSRGSYVVVIVLAIHSKSSPRSWPKEGRSLFFFFFGRKKGEVFNKVFWKVFTSSLPWRGNLMEVVFV